MHKYIPIEKLLAKAYVRASLPKITRPPVHPPPASSMRKNVTEIYDQGQIGSCTANAFCAAFRLVEKDKSFHPSRLWVYFYERLMEDPQHKVSNLADTGADVIDGEEYVRVHGVCSESLW